MHQAFGISEAVLELAARAETEARPGFDRIVEVRAHNQLKVIRAMQRHRVSDTHFAGTTGYGYNDRGREVLEAVYADAFGAEDALVRHQITCGSHALAIALYALLRPGDELLSITGKPYDTLEEVIGTRGTKGSGSLMEYGITYRELPLGTDGRMDLAALSSHVTPNTRVIFIQRSRGYAVRPPIMVADIAEAVKAVKAIRPDIRVMVDNCYGEFTEKLEPTDVGVDLMAGSLIKNPGGGLAHSGGYLAGTKECVELAAFRMTLPGIGREVGASLGQNRLMFQGFFMAPHTVAEALQGAVFAAAMMKLAGFETFPGVMDDRCDLIQTVSLGSAEAVVAFCRGIQKGSPVDSFVTPEPWDMPGYDCPVVMAAGAFVQGSSIELSADAPIRAPYTAYMQGGLVYDHVKLGVMMACEELASIGRLKAGGA